MFLKRKSNPGPGQYASYFGQLNQNIKPRYTKLKQIIQKDLQEKLLDADTKPLLIKSSSLQSIGQQGL
jgi:hypothetical protein